jgi:glucosylceramidase
VKWIQAYQAAGIPIWAVTPQNEPMHETTSYPSMRMEWSDEANFIKNNLGPALSSAGLGNVKIIALDHNWDLYTFPQNLLSDPAAYNYTAGTGFHCYSAGLTNQTIIHNAFPSKDIWHTECSDGMWIGGGTFAGMFDRGMREMTIGVVRNWAKATIKWNLALDVNHGPTNGGCMDCLGTVTVNGSNVTYNAEYYFLGHASKFVQRGARRIDSNETGGITTVAFRNPNGGKVLVAYNQNAGSTAFRVRWAGQTFNYTLAGKAAATFTWNTATGPTPTATARPRATATSRTRATATARPRATATSTPRPGGIANGTYKIIARHSAKAVDASGTGDGANVHQWTYVGGNNQKWTVTSLGGGQYQIQNVAANKTLDVSNAGTANGTNVQIWTWANVNQQKWTITPTDSGYYRISPVHAPSMALDVSGPSTADGANIHIWTWGAGTNQQFAFQTP